MRVAASLLLIVMLAGCATSSNPTVTCAGSVTPNYVSGMGGASCGAPVPCYALTETERKTVARCQRWEEKPLLERAILRVIYFATGG